MEFNVADLIKSHKEHEKKLGSQARDIMELRKETEENKNDIKELQVDVTNLKIGEVKRDEQISKIMNSIDALSKSLDKFGDKLEQFIKTLVGTTLVTLLGFFIWYIQSLTR